MTKLKTDVYRVTQAGETLFISLEKVSPREFRNHHRRNRSLRLQIVAKTLEIPVVPSEIELWDGGDRLYPHLHFTCPRCQRVHNVDLSDDDPNPRLGVCDSCDWESLVWIEWDEAARAAMDTDKEKYLAREIAAMRLNPPSLIEIDVMMYSLERFAESHPDAACRLMIAFWPVPAGVVGVHDVCSAIDLWIDAHRSPGVMARIAQLAASESDLELRDYCKGLLESLRE
jgi:hypothetical protein